MSDSNNKCPSLHIDSWGTKLQPDGIERGITSDAYYHVRLEDGRTGYISVLELEKFGTDVDPAEAAAECRRRDEPRVG